MDAKISVIVPIYKVEDYLSQCLDSIVNQTYSNLEIILVDDGSPDSCPNICEEYAAKDGRIKVIHKINGGLSSARNAGLRISTGDYITFVDSDDWLDINMYKIMLDAQQKTNSDISSCGIYLSYQDKKNVATSISNFRVINDSFEIINMMLPTSAGSIRFMVWNKLYKRSVIADSKFIEGQIYEDLHFEREVMMRCNSLVQVPKPLYYYRQQRSGSTATFFNNRKLCKFPELDLYIELLKKNGHKKYSKNYIKYAFDSARELYDSALNFNATSEEKEILLDKIGLYYSSLPVFKKFVYFPLKMHYAFIRLKRK